MPTDALRAELEAAYSEAVAALDDGDVEAFLAAVRAPVADAEEAVRADFEQSPGIFRQVMPDLAHTAFVAVRTAGEDLAGYYHTRVNPRDPTQAQVILSRFVRIDGSWKLLLSGTIQGFEHQPDEDLQAKAREFVDTDLPLRPG